MKRHARLRAATIRAIRKGVRKISRHHLIPSPGVRLHRLMHIMRWSLTTRHARVVCGTASRARGVASFARETRRRLGTTSRGPIRVVPRTRRPAIVRDARCIDVRRRARRRFDWFRRNRLRRRRRISVWKLTRASPAPRAGRGDHRHERRRQRARRGHRRIRAPHRPRAHRSHTRVDARRRVWITRRKSRAAAHGDARARTGARTGARQATSAR